MDEDNIHQYKVSAVKKLQIKCVGVHQEQENVTNQTAG